MNALFLGKNETQFTGTTTGRRKLLAPSCTELCKQCIEIPTYFHLSGYSLDKKNLSRPWIIPHPSTDMWTLKQELGNQSLTGVSVSLDQFSSIEEVYQMIFDNMQVLNNRYADTPFRFRWMNTDPTQASVAVDNKNVFFYAGDIQKTNQFATAQHRGDDVKSLNVYLVYRICGHEFIWLESNCITIGTS